MALRDTTGLDAAICRITFAGAGIIARHKACGRGFKDLGSRNGEHGIIERIKDDKLIGHDLIGQTPPYAGRQGKF